MTEQNSIAQNYQAPDDLLKDKVILVTGAGDGIGKTVAKSYATHGATVILLGRTQVKLEAVYDEIVAAGGPQPGIAVLDFRTAQPEEYENLAEQIENEYGRLDGLLHNASKLGQKMSLDQYPIGTFMEVMHINVNAAFVLTRILMPLLRKSSSASVVFTSSSVGRKGRAFWGAYAVSKFATEGLMETLADEQGENSKLRTNSINPGATRTNMRAAAYPGEDPDTLKTPEDILAPYLYLMGDDSSAVNGESLNCQ